MEFNPRSRSNPRGFRQSRLATLYEVPELTQNDTQNQSLVKVNNDNSIQNDYSFETKGAMLKKQSLQRIDISMFKSKNTSPFVRFDTPLDQHSARKIQKISHSLERNSVNDNQSLQRSQQSFGKIVYVDDAIFSGREARFSTPMRQDDSHFVHSVRNQHSFNQNKISKREKKQSSRQEIQEKSFKVFRKSILQMNLQNLIPARENKQKKKLKERNAQHLSLQEQPEFNPESSFQNSLHSQVGTQTFNNILKSNVLLKQMAESSSNNRNALLQRGIQQMLTSVQASKRRENEILSTKRSKVSQYLQRNIIKLQSQVLQQELARNSKNIGTFSEIEKQYLSHGIRDKILEIESDSQLQILDTMIQLCKMGLTGKGERVLYNIEEIDPQIRKPTTIEEILSYILPENKKVEHSYLSDIYIQPRKQCEICQMKGNYEQVKLKDQVKLKGRSFIVNSQMKMFILGREEKKVTPFSMTIEDIAAYSKWMKNQSNTQNEIGAQLSKLEEHSRKALLVQDQVLDQEPNKEFQEFVFNQGQDYGMLKMDHQRSQKVTRLSANKIGKVNKKNKSLHSEERQSENASHFIQHTQMDPNYLDYPAQWNNPSNMGGHSKYLKSSIQASNTPKSQSSKNFTEQQLQLKKPIQQKDSSHQSVYSNNLYQTQSFNLSKSRGNTQQVSKSKFRDTKTIPVKNENSGKDCTFKSLGVQQEATSNSIFSPRLKEQSQRNMTSHQCLVTEQHIKQFATQYSGDLVGRIDQDGVIAKEELLEAEESDDLQDEVGVECFICKYPFQMHNLNLTPAEIQYLVQAPSPQSPEPEPYFAQKRVAFKEELLKRKQTQKSENFFNIAEPAKPVNRAYAYSFSDPNYVWNQDSPPQRFTCEFCCQEFLRDRVCLLPCGKANCMSCFAKMAKWQIYRGEEMVCCLHCGIKLQFEGEAGTIIKHLKFQYGVKINPSNCYNCQAPNMYLSKMGNKLICDTCYSEFCPTCKYSFHSGSCLSYLSKKYDSYIRCSIFQLCPECQSPCQIEPSCENHLKCRNCQFIFCSLCRKQMNYHHFNPLAESSCQHLFEEEKSEEQLKDFVEIHTGGSRISKGIYGLAIFICIITLPILLLLVFPFLILKCKKSYKPYFTNRRRRT